MPLTNVRPQDLADWAVERGDVGAQKPLLLDVREAWELNLSSVLTHASSAAFEAAHMPMQELPGALARLDPERPTAVLCHHGIRSLHVGHWLIQNGFEDVANVAGGIDAWAKHLDPSIGLY